MSKGIFEYARPDIVLSEGEIYLEAGPGKKVEGSFEINSINNVEIRAMLFSSNKHMKCLDKAFIGESGRVFYRFDGTALDAGQVITGHFSIVSNGGEIELPYRIKVTEPYFETSIGNIRELPEFAELARHNWSEAVNVFLQPLFPRVFLTNKKFLSSYNLLIKSQDPNRALEEFLCYAKRKKPVHIKVYQNELEYARLKEPVSESVVIEKDTWGYEKLTITPYGNFIKCSKRTITTDDFLGSYYELNFEIDPRAMNRGNEFGKIVISTFDNTFVIPVKCINEYRDDETVRRKTISELKRDLTSVYVDHYTGVMKDHVWKAETQEILAGLRSYDDNKTLYTMYEAHYTALIGRGSDAVEVLETLNIKEIKEGDPLIYAYYLYIMAIARGDESYTRYAVQKLETMIDRDPGRHEVYLMLAGVDRNMSKEKKLDLLKDAFDTGSRSPVLYAHAAKLVNEDPGLLKEAGGFEIQVMNWANKHKICEPAAAFRFATHLHKNRYFSLIALNTLIDFYNQHKNKEILNAICSLLICGGRKEYRYNEWYKEGILQGIRITELYEYYMYSLDDNPNREIPREVLLYFNYDNGLPVDRRALLYAYVIRHKEDHPEVFRAYENIMKAFTHEQLTKAYVDRHMIELYRYFINGSNISRKVTQYLPNILFKHEVTCGNLGIRGVIVSQREIDKEKYYPINNMRAYVDIYMEDYNIALVDDDNNRY
ncbi:MAG: hypothetical protein IJL97_05000, partial [Lachnospiraceae bacterium]|nr:hypothetical protein [Lachnospiraceae bacterium]